MKKILLLILVTLTFGFDAFAQQGPAIGIRLGAETTGTVVGATIQQPLGKHSVLEGLITAGNKDMRITGLYEYHQRLPIVIKGVNWYVGGGFHIARLHSSTLEGLINDITNGNIDINGDPDKNYYGLDAIAGLQWNIPKMPINVSVDLKPALNLTGNTVDKFEFGGALSVRWTLGGGGGGSGKGQGSGSGTGAGSGTGSGKGKAGGVKGGTNSSGSTTGTGSKGTKTKTYTPKGPPTGTGSTSGSGTTAKPSKTKSYTPPGSPRPNPAPPVPDPTPPPNPNPNDNDTGNGDDNGNNNGESWGDDDGGI